MESRLRWLDAAFDDVPTLSKWLRNIRCDADI